MAPTTVASQLRAIQEDIGALRDALGEIQNRLADVTRQAIDERTTLLTQIEELQLENEQLQNDGRWLRNQKDELERRNDLRKPEVDNVLYAKDAAVRRLRRCQRVVRDLLDERLECSEGPAPAATGSKKLPDEVVERMAQEVLGDINTSGTTTTSTRTSQNQRRRGQQSGRPLKLPTITQQEVSGEHSGGNMPLAAGTRVRIIGGDVPAGRAGPHSTETETERPHETAVVPRSDRAGPSTQPVTTEPLRLTVVNKPRFLPRPWGPTEWDELTAKLSSDGDDAEFKLEEIKASTTPCIRLSIIKDFAFVLDPIFLESSQTKQTYFIDWGEAANHEDIAKFIDVNRGGHVMLHTFIFLSREGWYYIGALGWSVAKLPSKIWPLLSDKKRETVITKLVARSQGEMTNEEVEQHLDDERFGQFCIELSSREYLDVMREFMVKMGYRRMTTPK